MKEIISMVSRSLSSPSPKIVSIFIWVEKPLSLSDPILKLLQSNYTLSNIEVFFAGKTASFLKKEVLQIFRHKVKAVKALTISSIESIYAHIGSSSRGEICLFVGSDCSPDRNWIKAMIENFYEDESVGMVVGETQQKRVDFKNKIEQFCEQTGWGSVGEFLGAKETLDLNRAKVFEPIDIGRISRFLKPNNVAFRRSALMGPPKNGRGRIGNTFFDVVWKLALEKSKFIYSPLGVVERFHSMDFKELDHDILTQVFQKINWLSRDSRRLKIGIQFWDYHELSLPFWIPVDISWGDFHWLNLLGIWIVGEFGSWFFFHHDEGTFWFSDKILLMGCVFGFFLFKYFLPVLKIQPWSDFILWCWIRYRTNMSMFLTGLWVSIKLKCFYWGESW